MFGEQTTIDALQSYYRSHKPPMIVLTTSGKETYFHQIAAAQIRDQRHFVAVIQGGVPECWKPLADEYGVKYLHSGHTHTHTSTPILLK